MRKPKKITDNEAYGDERCINAVSVRYNMALAGISDLTFRRYVAELRCYFVEWRPYEEIVYRKGDGVYFLKEAG